MNLKKLEFEGAEFEYDADAVKSYKVIKKIARAQKDLVGFFDAFELVFAGNDEEYADKLGDNFEKIGELISAAVNAENEAKN